MTATILCSTIQCIDSITRVHVKTWRGKATPMTYDDGRTDKKLPFSSLVGGFASITYVYITFGMFYILNHTCMILLACANVCFLPVTGA